MKHLFLALIICITVSACMKQSKGSDMVNNEEEEIVIMGNQSLDLTKEELELYSQKALKGDNEAAMKVSMYYGFIKMNYEEQIKWTELAAKNGDISAMHNAVIIYSVMNPPQYENSIHWAEQYKEHSIKKANALIQAFKSCLTTGTKKDNIYQEDVYRNIPSFQMNKEELKRAKEEAERELQDAYWRLFLHYTFEENHKEAEKWLVKLGNEGNVPAMEDLAFIYYTQDRFEEAIYWIEKFKEYRGKEADELIQWMKEKSNSL